jgi:hypothetical protein
MNVTPEVRRAAGTIEITWAAQRVQAVVSRMHSSTGGGVNSEVAFKRVREDGSVGHLEVCSLNLLSSPTKHSLAKKLDDLYNLEKVGATWTILVEQMAVLALKAIREGDPLQELSTNLPATPPVYLLDPLLQQGQHTVIFGLGGTGKSYLAMMLGITVALPYVDNHLGLWPGKVPRRVLYLDWETSYDALQWRLHKIAAGMGLPDVKLDYRRCALPLAADIEAIASAVIKTDAKLVIVDSLGPATDGDLNKPEAALDLFRALRQLGNDVTSLLIAHTAKGNGNDPKAEKTIFGSAFFTNAARKVYELKGDPEAADDTIQVAVMDRKSNDTARAKPWGLTINFGEESTRFTRTEVASMGLLAENLSYSQRITHLLKTTGKTTAIEMIEELGIEKDALWPALSRMKQRGQVVKLGDYYALAVQ